MYTPTSSTPTASMITSTRLHKQGAFDVDENAFYRSLLVISFLILIFGVWITIKILRRKKSGSRIRRYDILSAKQLAPDLVGSEDSDDELFGPVRIDDSNKRLVESTSAS